MTEKQEKILEAALELFAKEGFKTTSTSKIAKRAGVSEGLIFRHFENKEGLLKAILKVGEEKAKELFADIVFETDAKETIRKTFDMMLDFKNKHEDLEFWKLQYKIKWETEKYGEHKMEPLFLALSNAFSKLNYPSPQLEAQLILIYLDGIATKFLLQEKFNLDEVIFFLKSKYQI